MSGLTTSDRKSLSDNDFAVPGKRKLPIPDERHVRLAWSQVGRTQGLSEDERAEARSRIMRRAKELGLDTADWDTIRAMRLEAMSLNVPAVEDHPNRMPFSGVLVKLDQASQAPPHGSNGKRVLMTAAAAEASIASLLGMAVDFTPDLDGHDPVSKFGVITSATVEGTDLKIEGFIYAADFPKEASDVKKLQASLGFSFEAQNIHVESLDTDPVVITGCTFTGAAILRKDKAAFMTTSLAAAADLGDLDMTKEELEAILAPALATALKPVNDKIAAIEASQGTIIKDMAAGKELHAKISPFAEKLRACAGGMQAAGIGVHATKGHVAVLNRMADGMEAEAMTGSMPHIFRDHDYYPSVYAAAETDRQAAPAEDPAVKALKEQLASVETVLKDLKAAKVDNAPAPERKTISPTIERLLAKSGIKPNDDGKLAVHDVDKALKEAGLDISERLRTKAALGQAGILENVS